MRINRTNFFYIYNYLSLMQQEESEQKSPTLSYKKFDQKLSENPSSLIGQQLSQFSLKNNFFDGNERNRQVQMQDIFQYSESQPINQGSASFQTDPPNESQLVNKEPNSTNRNERRRRKKKGKAPSHRESKFDRYRTNNILSLFKPIFMNYIAENRDGDGDGDGGRNNADVLDRINSRRWITKQDYIDILSMDEIKWDLFFDHKRINQNFEMSGCRPNYKKFCCRNIHVFKQVYKTKVFPHIVHPGFQN